MISKRAKLVEISLKSIGFKNIANKMMLTPKRKDKRELPPKRFAKKYNAQISDINGMKCITATSTQSADMHILYFHGGSYTLQANSMHWRIVDYILSAIGCAVTFINYPLVPEYTCVQTVEMVTDAYMQLCAKSTKNLVLMGDSAGGGLALSLAQVIKNKKIEPRPKKLVLLSPWLDVSMDNDIPADLAEKDLVLDKDILKVVGKRYAGQLLPKDPLCSPLYADMDDMGEIALFSGTSDILNVQAKLLVDKVNKAKGSIKYHEFADIQHFWMGMPIPEAKDALRKVCDFLSIE